MSWKGVYKKDLGPDLYPILQDFIIQETDIELGKQIGDGFFGVVHQAKIRSTGKYVAVKFLIGKK